MRLFSTCIVCCILFLFSSCEKFSYSDELTVPIITISLEQENERGVTVSSEVIEPQGRTVNAAYLNWYPSNSRHYQESPRYLLSVESADERRFTATINRDIIKDQAYVYKFIYELDGGERLYTSEITSSFSGTSTQPITEEFSFNKNLAILAEEFQATDEGFELIADNTRYVYTGNNFLQREAISSGDVAVQILFSNSFDVSFFVRLEGKTLYTKQAEQDARAEIWQHIDGSQTVTRIGEIFKPTAAQVIQGKIFFTTESRDVRVISSLTPFTLEAAVSDNPYSGDSRVRATYLSSSEDKLYVLTKKSEGTSPVIPSFLRLYAYDVNAEAWEELPVPPGSSGGEVWISAEPGRLLFGGNLKDRRAENDLWVLNESSDDGWQFIGWLPIKNIVGTISPRFSDGKHRLIGVKNNDSDLAYYFTIDLNNLVDL